MPEYTYEKDENGERIAISFRDRFKNDLDAKKKQYPGHMYSCVLTETQLKQTKYAWLPILKENGFEFVRRWTNSVHGDREYLYLFVLCTDEKGRCKGDFTQPPKGWAGLPEAQAEEKPSTFQRLKVAASKAA